MPAKDRNPNSDHPGNLSSEDGFLSDGQGAESADSFPSEDFSALTPSDSTSSEDSSDTFEPFSGELRIYTRDDHNVSRKYIDKDAVKALYRLHDNGYKGYLVGGAVRDIMLGKKPKDFDIATSATPQQVKKLFRNCRIIGRRFRLAHLYYAQNKILEVATFRSSGGADEIVREGELIRRDNVYGSPEEDACRRDLTINGLFYDIGSFSIFDYVGGVDDLRSGKVRMVGDPSYSFKEDPVRLLRAIRHSTRLGFEIEPQTLEALVENRAEILKANRARLLEEFLKDLVSGKATEYFSGLHRLGFLELLIPDLHDRLEDDEEHRSWLAMLTRVDEEVANGAPVQPAQALAALVGPFVTEVLDQDDVRSMKAFRDRRSAFREQTQPVLSQLKVYKRDEDRLWSAMGGLHKVEELDSWDEIPEGIRSKHWLLDTIQVLYLLKGDSDRIQPWLVKVRKMELDLPPDSGRKRRPPRKRKRLGVASSPSAEGASSAETTEIEKSSPRKRRRRRRRPRGADPSKG